MKIDWRVISVPIIITHVGEIKLVGLNSEFCWFNVVGIFFFVPQNGKVNEFWSFYMVQYNLLFICGKRPVAERSQIEIIQKSHFAPVFSSYLCWTTISNIPLTGCLIQVSKGGHHAASHMKVGVYTGTQVRLQGRNICLSLGLTSGTSVTTLIRPPLISDSKSNCVSHLSYFPITKTRAVCVVRKLCNVVGDAARSMRCWNTDVVHWHSATLSLDNKTETW